MSDDEKNEDLTLKEREVLTRPTFRTQPAGWTSGSVLLSGFTFLSECKLYKTWKKNWINRICGSCLLHLHQVKTIFYVFFVWAVNGQFWSCLPNSQWWQLTIVGTNIIYSIQVIGYSVWGQATQWQLKTSHHSSEHPSNWVFCLGGGHQSLGMFCSNLNSLALTRYFLDS